MEFSHRERFHLRASEGWLGLGETTEALKELEQITPEKREHPAVMNLRWEIHANRHEWETCAEIAAVLVATNPKDASGWIHRSYSLHEMRRTQEAYDSLLRAAKQFKSEPTIFYNLACYCAQLGRLEEARQHLDQALGLSEHPAALRKQAQEDPDLIPLWIKHKET